MSGVMMSMTTTMMQWCGSHDADLDLDLGLDSCPDLCHDLDLAHCGVVSMMIHYVHLDVDLDLLTAILILILFVIVAVS